jgi:hypothetical protein
MAISRATIPAGSVPFVTSNGVLTEYGRDLLVKLIKAANEAPGTVLNLPKETPLGIAPGTGQSSIQAVAGTAPGTAKLIMYAGTSAVPTTIIDNCGSGF